ncbi:short-chain dehydrogenase [Moniliophthora roreri]|nr:short-chain dehydrogenase [Moniliophthora roreri]
MVNQVKQKEKHVDVLVNNSGIAEGRSSVEVGSEEGGAQKLSDELFGEDQNLWEEVYRTNVIGHFFTAAALIPLLSTSTANRPGHSGTIINISSISGITRTSLVMLRAWLERAQAHQTSSPSLEPPEARAIGRAWLRPGLLGITCLHPRAALSIISSRAQALGLGFQKCKPEP